MIEPAAELDLIEARAFLPGPGLFAQGGALARLFFAHAIHYGCPR